MVKQPIMEKNIDTSKGIFGASFCSSKTRKTPSECIQKGFLNLELWRWANYSGDFLGFKIILQPIEYNRVNEGK